MVDLTLMRTLFLDRDGVINVERKNDYAKNITEFAFIDGALDAIALLSAKFDNIFIVTNQRGVGRGVMSQADLDMVHEYMIKEIEARNGQISKIYTCTDINSDSINRKPNTGMAFLARKDFPAVEFKRSVLVGNSKSDIQFGKKLDMYTVLVGDKYPRDNEIYDIIDAYFPNLYEFALSLYNTENNTYTK